MATDEIDAMLGLAGLQRVRAMITKFTSDQRHRIPYQP